MRMLKKCMNPRSTITRPILVLRNSMTPTTSIGFAPLAQCEGDETNIYQVKAN
jgi:hypothetical protein